MAPRVNMVSPAAAAPTSAETRVHGRRDLRSHRWGPLGVRDRLRQLAVERSGLELWLPRAAKSAASEIGLLWRAIEGTEGYVPEQLTVGSVAQMVHEGVDCNFLSAVGRPNRGCGLAGCCAQPGHLGRDMHIQGFTRSSSEVRPWGNPQASLRRIEPWERPSPDLADLDE
jgi:hypothetical protein